MAKPPRIWLTRPMADSESMAAQLAAQNILSIIAPVMHIVPAPLASVPEHATAILLTSRHAAQALAQLPGAWRTLPTYCVGSGTANAAIAHGMIHVIPGMSDVMAMLPRIGADMGEGKKLLYLAGEETSVDVAHLLAARGVQVSTHIAYRAVAETGLNDTLRAALVRGEVSGVAFFSPRSATIACELLTSEGLANVAATIDAFCFSLNVASTARKLGWKTIHTCHLPTRRAMGELIVSHSTKTL